MDGQSHRGSAECGLPVGMRFTAPVVLWAVLLSGAGVCLLVQSSAPGIFPGREVTTPFQRGEHEVPLGPGSTT